jgi:hypothetical protein
VVLVVVDLVDEAKQKSWRWKFGMAFFSDQDGPCVCATSTLLPSKKVIGIFKLYSSSIFYDWCLVFSLNSPLVQPCSPQVTAGLAL